MDMPPKSPKKNLKNATHVYAYCVTHVFAPCREEVFHPRRQPFVRQPWTKPQAVTFSQEIAFLWPDSVILTECRISDNL
jgi:hypothetical protein